MYLFLCVYYKCKHVGCAYEGVDVSAHEESCAYQLIECRLCCDDDGENCTHPEFRLKDYTQHLIEHHGVRNTRSVETPQTFIIGKSEDYTNGGTMTHYYSKNYFHLRVVQVHIFEEHYSKSLKTKQTVFPCELNEPTCNKKAKYSKGPAYCPQVYGKHGTESAK